MCKWPVGGLQRPHADKEWNDGSPGEQNYYDIGSVVYLNDDYTGGELEFPNQNVKIKPEAGSIIVFPSSVPYLHQSNEILSGEKYMCPGFWLHDVV